MKSNKPFAPPEQLSSGYQLFQRGEKWHMRFSVRGEKQQRIALGTSDRAEADRLAYARWVHTCMMVQGGVSLSAKEFPEVAEEFIASMEKAVERGQRAPYHLTQYAPAIRRYFIEYFGKRPIKSITPRDIEGYWDWRRDYWIGGPGAEQKAIVYTRTVNGNTTKPISRNIRRVYPSDSTLSKEAGLLSQIFEFGVRNGYADVVPPFAFTRSKRRQDRSRPGFTLDEFKHLLDVSERRIAAPDIIAHIRRDRLKLHAFCMIAGLTGMRPTEMFNLNWGDIETRRLEVPLKTPVASVPVRSARGGTTIKHAEWPPRFDVFQDVIVIHARGKGKQRETATMPEVLTPLNLLRNLFLLEVKREPNKDDPVFFNVSGTRVRSFKHGLSTLLEAAELRVAPDGRLRDSFSFRHLYMTQQIREDVNHHMLARNAGTSTKMIDNFYSKVRATEEITKLTPDWFGHRLL
jgi:integrase